MSQDFLAYWKPRAVDAQVEVGGTLDHAAGNARIRVYCGHGDSTPYQRCADTGWTGRYHNYMGRAASHTIPRWYQLCSGTRPIARYRVAARVRERQPEAA